MILPDPETCRALARAVTEAGKWRWLRGMMDTEDRDVCRVLADGTAEYWPGVGYNEPLPSDSIPDFSDPLTAAGAQTVAETVLNEPTLHLVPVSIDRYYDAEPVTHWRVERMVDGESEWLRESGTWGEWEAEAHKDPPICCKTKLEALIAAILAAPEKP